MNIDDSQFCMEDVRCERPTPWRAVATGCLFVGPVVFGQIKQQKLPNGNALAAAEIGAINGARRAGDIMPLRQSRPIELVRTHFAFHPHDHSIQAWCEVATTAKSGVEMEALSAVSSALLSIYDLTKPVQPALSIGGVRLLFREGGKEGLWVHPDGISEAERDLFRPQYVLGLDGIRTACITLSDRAAKGLYPDRSGPLLARMLSDMGASVEETILIPDHPTELSFHLRRLVASGASLVVTTGGTGPGPRDRTAETVRSLISRELHGIGELLRSESANHTPLSWLGSGLAGLIGNTLVITLPGSTKAVSESMRILEPILPHLLRTINGQNCDELPGACNAQNA